jgi:fibronectin-binding autotransporter adhesin
MSLRTLLSMSLAAGVLLAAGPAQALNSNYFNKANDDYNAAGNWSMGWVPTTTDNGLIATGYTAILSSSALTTVPNILYVGFAGGVAGDGDGTLNVNDAAAILKTSNLYVGYANGTATTACTGTLNLSAGSISVTAGMLLGVGTLPASPFGSTGRCEQTGGTLSCQSLYLGNVDKTSGTLTITGAGSSFTASTTYLGYREGSTGVLTVGTAGGADACNLALGATSIGHGLLNTGVGSSGTVTVQGAATCTATSLTIGGGTSPGIAATGYVYVKDSATFTATSTVGLGGYATGVFDQSGGSVTFATSFNYIGRYATGNGTYNISGGTLNVSSTSGTLSLAHTAGGTGTMRVSSTASVILGPRLWVGTSGTGTYDQTGGTTTANNYVYVGLNAAGRGILSVGGGTDTAVFSAAAAAKDSYIGYNGGGTLTLGSNGIFDAGVNTVYLAAGTVTGSAATGYFAQTGGSFASGGLAVGNYGAGAYSLEGGTATVSGQFTIGRATGGNGTCDLKGGVLSTPLMVVGGSGTGTLNFSGGTADLGGGTVTGVGTFNFSGGTLKDAGTVNVAVNLATGGSGAVFYASAGSTSAVSGSMSGNGGPTKTGAGALVLSGPNTYIGLTAVNDGTLEVGTAARDPILTLGGGAEVGGGQLVFDYSGGSASSILSTIQTAVDGGTIHAPTTSAALICLDNLTNAVTVKNTLFGDADFNGTVNGADLNAVLSNYNAVVTAGRSGWQSGDFDYNGTVNGADLNIVLSNYNQSLSIGAAVPEPSALALIAAGLAGVLAHAWKKRNGKS